MKICISIDRLPELSDLTEEQRRAVLFYYQLRQPKQPGLQLGDAGFVGLIILAEIAGFIGGFVYWHTPFWGPLAGALIALVLVMVLGYAFNLYRMIPRFRRFLHSDEAQSFIKMLKQPKEASAA